MGARTTINVADAAHGRPPARISRSPRFGAATILPQGIRPQTISRLTPGTIVDEDAVTPLRTTFFGISGNFAVVVEDGPFDGTKAIFDIHIGLIAAEEDARQIGTAWTQVRVQLVPGR